MNIEEQHFIWRPNASLSAGNVKTKPLLSKFKKSPLRAGVGGAKQHNALHLKNRFEIYQKRQFLPLVPTYHQMVGIPFLTLLLGEYVKLIASFNFVI